jgi:hypothetical protein
MKVYATVPGAEVWIPPYGTATNELPCIVPAEVGEELAAAEGLRVESEAPAPAPKRKFHAPLAPEKE